MPTQKKMNVVAIFSADYHLSARAPAFREQEPDWFRAMGRVLGEIWELSDRYKCPVIIAGDIFDYWNIPPSVFNYILDRFPKKVYAIPGQHDLPHHSTNLLREVSAYWTLTLALQGRFQHMGGWKTHVIPSKLKKYRTLRLHPVPYGQRPKLNYNKDGYTFDVAVIHSYVWIPGHRYRKAVSESHSATNMCRMIDGRMGGYDLIVCGDNHSAFTVRRGKTRIINCGCTMIQSKTEREYEPSVWLLDDKGIIHRHKLDTSKDVLGPAKIISKKEVAVEIQSFAREVEQLYASGLDVEQAIESYLDQMQPSERVKALIVETISDVKNKRLESGS